VAKVVFSFGLTLDVAIMTPIETPAAMRQYLIAVVTALLFAMRAKRTFIHETPILTRNSQDITLASYHIVPRLIKIGRVVENSSRHIKERPQGSRLMSGESERASGEP
jgi:hypothetical protein